jgi:hypothetical protein
MVKTTGKPIWLTLFLSISLIAIAAIAHPKTAEAVSERMKNMISGKFKSADKKLLQNFDVIDTNKDGMITESELFAAFDNGVIKR